MYTKKGQQFFLTHYYGYYKGEIDGIEGPLHKDGTEAFQRAHGLVPDSVWGPKTDKKAIECTKELQRLLNENGAALKVDGILGPETADAILAFQTAKGLAADGIAGAKTMAALKGITSTGALSISQSKYFKKSEFKCKCGKYCNGYPAEIGSRLVWILEELRNYYGKPVVITSGLRCRQHNANVGGVSNSKHRYGKAADIYIAGICDSASGRNQVKAKAYALGAAYSYCNTAGMGRAVHINV